MSKDNRGFSFDKEFGREFEPVEETVVLSDVMLRAVERYKPDDPEVTKEYRLLVIDPSGEEWAYPVKGELMIGRAPDNQIVLKDRAVSRHHLAVNTDGTRYWFKDLGSGNGTQVNGEYLDEGWLVGGEEILIGNSKIYFLQPDIEPPKELLEGEKPEDKKEEGAEGEGQEKGEEEDKKTSKSNLGLILILLFFAFGSMGGVGWFVYQKFFAKKAEEDPELQKKKASKLLDEGRALLRQKRWKEAEGVFKEAVAILPIEDPLYKSAVKYMRIATNELKAKRLYEKAEELYIEEDDPKRALSVLKKISKDSDIYEKAKKLKRKIWKKDVLPLVKEAKLLIEVNKLDAALQKLKKALDIAPTLREAKELIKKIKSGEIKAKEEKKEESKPVRRKTGSVSFREGLDLYRSGNYARAVVFFRRLEGRAGSRRIRRKARIYRKAVLRFQEGLSAGKRAASRGQIDRAIRYLSQALSADRTLGGYHRSKIAPLLSKLLAKRGERYLRMGNTSAAARDLKRAIALNSRNTRAHLAIKKLRGKAKGLIEEAEVLLDVDKEAAKKRLYKAKALLSPSDPLYSKAVNLLKKVQ